MVKHRITRHELEYENGIPKRGYYNFDPPGDRLTYESLSINDEYLGYKGIVYTPIDMPILEIDKNHIWELLNGDIIKDKYPKEYDERSFQCMGGAGLVLFMKNNLFREPESDASWFDWVHYELPHVKEFIEQLPFIKIRQLSFVTPPKATDPHYDEPLNATAVMKHQSPSCYRVRWSDVTIPEEEVFYITRDSGATTLYPILPPETNTFVYDGSVFEHGGDSGFDMRDRVQIVISGRLDVEKHHTLLDKSIERFSDYVVYEDDFK